jgi:hypothetical protein
MESFYHYWRLTEISPVYLLMGRWSGMARIETIDATTMCSSGTAYKCADEPNDSWLYLDAFNGPNLSDAARGCGKVNGCICA